MKRGISALIISVILIGFVIALAAFMFFNLSGTTRGTFETVGVWEESARLIDFKLSLSPDTTCEDVDLKFNIGGGGDNPRCYAVLVENQMNEDISYIIRTMGNKGVQVANTPIFPAFTTKWIAVSYDEDVVGNDDSVTAEVIPVSYG